MFQMYHQFIDRYFKEEVLPKIEVNSGGNLLYEVVNQWKNYTIFATMLNRIFDYIDRNYIV